MKTLPAGMQAHLDDGTTTLAWCWCIERTDGVALGFTDHDESLSFLATSFEPETGFAATEIRAGSDLSVDAQDAEGALRSDRITETDILDGRWDNAQVDVWRVNWADVSQRVLMRRGNIGRIRRGVTAFFAEVRSLSHYLNQTVGRTCQFYCDADLGDARCGVVLTAPAYSGTGTVTAIYGDRRFYAGAPITGFASGWFDFGTVEWTSGANAGRRGEIASHLIGVTGATGATGAGLDLYERPMRAVQIGDGFVLRAGCDKRFTTCRTKFGNGVNFRGFPAIPGDDVVMRYPSQGDVNDGSSLVGTQ